MVLLARLRRGGRSPRLWPGKAQLRTGRRVAFSTSGSVPAPAWGFLWRRVGGNAAGDSPVPPRGERWLGVTSTRGVALTKAGRIRVPAGKSSRVKVLVISVFMILSPVSRSMALAGYGCAVASEALAKLIRAPRRGRCLAGAPGGAPAVAVDLRRPEIQAGAVAARATATWRSVPPINPPRAGLSGGCRERERVQCRESWVHYKWCF